MLNLTLSDGFCLGEGTRSLGHAHSVPCTRFCKAFHVDWQSVYFPCQTLNFCVPMVHSQGPGEWPQRHQQVFMALMIYGAVTVSQALCSALYIHHLICPLTCPGRKSLLSFLGLGEVCPFEVVQMVRVELVYIPGLITFALSCLLKLKDPFWSQPCYLVVM